MKVKLSMQRSIQKRFFKVHPKLVIGNGLIGGAIGGMAMAMFLMIYMAAAGMGFYSPLNIGLGSLFYTVTPPKSMLSMLTNAMGNHASPAMMAQMMSIKSGSATNRTVTSLMKAMPSGIRNTVMSSMPINASHIIVGAVAHLAFSMMLGVILALGYSIIKQYSFLPKQNRSALIAGSTLVSILVFLVNEYVILPIIAPMMTVLPAFPFLVAHIIFGLITGMVLTFRFAGSDKLSK